MDTIKFKPTRILLLFWIIGAGVASFGFGGIVTGALIESNIPPEKTFTWGGIILWVIISFYLTLYFFTIKYELDNRYITKESGVLWKQRRSIPLEKITNLDVRQGPLERIIGYGKIWIFTPSTGAATPEEKLDGITAPHKLKDKIIEYSEKAEISPKDNISPNATKLKTSDESLLILKEIRDSLKSIENAISNNQNSENN